MLDTHYIYYTTRRAWKGAFYFVFLVSWDSQLGVFFCLYILLLVVYLGGELYLFGQKKGERESGTLGNLLLLYSAVRTYVLQSYSRLSDRNRAVYF